MNILFYLDHSISSSFGGIEHATGQTSRAISGKGCLCYYIYRIEDSKNSKEESIPTPFVDGKFFEDLRRDNLLVLNKLKEWEIDTIVIQSVFDDSILVWRSLIEKLDHPCKLIFAYHYNPGSELDYIRNISLSFQSIVSKIRWRRYVKRIYNLIWKTSDNVVVLSKTHIKPWRKLASADSNEKFVVIPNMNSFDQSLQVEELEQKENTVLIVSRLSEHEKRISRLLNLWKKIEEDPTYNNWRLVVVGDGPDRNKYEQYAQENLFRCEFTGKQPSQNYFRKASLFIMASAQEGWGLVITEAQQMGCVPVVMNTFSSASDMIADGRNGFLVNSMCSFSKKLKFLMNNAVLREQLALNAIMDSERFSLDAIGQKWITLINRK